MKILRNIDNYLDSHKSIGIFILRLFIGIRLIYGVQDNIFSWEQMLEFTKFLEINGLPFPVLSAVVSVYLQFICAILLIVGYKTRFAAFLLVLNFIVAIGVHINFKDSIEGMTPALAIFFGCITILFTNAGKIAYSSIRKRQ